MKIRNSMILFIAALIWGVAFVAQSEGGEIMGAYTFTCLRSFLGAAVLMPYIFIGKRKNSCAGDEMGSERKESRKTLAVAGICCGTSLAVASMFQQIAINMGAGVGKAGFLTSCYIILVPLIGMAVGRKCSRNIWFGVILALAGIYLLCMTDSFSLEKTDILLLLCALSFAVQILFIDHFSPQVDCIKLSCLEFFVEGIICAVPMIFLEMKPFSGGFGDFCAIFRNRAPWIPLLYAGIMSNGVAYTFQVIGQKGLNPTVASLIMSLESAVSVLAGWILLHESLTQRELIGCLTIFIAIVIAQLPAGKGQKKGEKMYGC